jgi:hypothetical protein
MIKLFVLGSPNTPEFEEHSQEQWRIKKRHHDEYWMLQCLSSCKNATINHSYMYDQ